MLHHYLIVPLTTGAQGLKIAVMGRVKWRYFGSLGVSVFAVLFAASACSDDEVKQQGANVGGGSNVGSEPGAGGDETSTGGSLRGGNSSDGGDGPMSSGGSTSGPGASVNEFWLGFADALCWRYRNCAAAEYNDLGNRVRLKAMGSQQDCTELLLPVITRGSRETVLSTAVAAGKLELAGDRFEECFIAAKLCDYPGADPTTGEITLADVTPCREVFEGSVPEGGGCDISEECGGDSMCVLAPEPTAGACAGTCAPRLQVGEMCTGSRACGGPPGSFPYCDVDTCAAPEITAPAAVSEACASNSQVVTGCEEGAWCPDRFCVPFVASGACTGPDEALATSKCLTGVCNAVECQPITVVDEVGASCDDNTVICNVFEGLACIGSECAVNEGPLNSIDCQTYTWYSAALCTPVPLAAVGEFCNDPAQCESSLCRYPDGCLEPPCTLR